MKNPETESFESLSASGRILIVAGDEMQKQMCRNHPGIRSIPFREDLSKGDPAGFFRSRDFVAERSSFWGVSEADYLEKMSPIFHLDFSKRYVLCFGEDDCCKANLRFLIGYLRENRYPFPIDVRIVDEQTLFVKKAYTE